MSTWQKKAAQQFDGQLPEGSAASTPEAQEYLAGLEYLRTGVRAVSAIPEISDAQFSAFMSGIREGIEVQATPRRGLWAAFSLVAAALVVSISVFVIWESSNVVQPPVVNADSVVESATTDISGATVNSGTSDDGNAVVWVDAKSKDLW